MKEELRELSYEEFHRARKLYWEKESSQPPAVRAVTNSDRTGEEDGASGFMLYAPGPDEVIAVFEDSAQSGWFYLYGVKQRGILRSAHIYDRKNVIVDEDVVDIGWAVDGSVSGLAVWGEFRAFLGVLKDLELRKPVMDAEERGIPASDWPAGFERYIEKKIE